METIKIKKVPDSISTIIKDMVAERIIAMPMYHKDTEFLLNKESWNKQYAEALLNSNPKLLKQFDEYNFLYYSNNYIGLYNSKSKKLFYYVFYVKEKYFFTDKEVIRCKVLWADRVNKYVLGLPSNVYFKYILPQTGIGITDKLQTTKGERYWKGLIAKIFSKYSKLHVYYIDLDSNKIIHVKGYEDFEEVVNDKQPWGNEEHHQKRRFVISKFLIKNSKP